ncbi:hypothetical protein PVAG01_03958 [Phlyctema vagabunda]|uniref:Integral membrane protein n=1 Tax=Phlyctema vagabunda TaxID=108571 RepID=A0ABR4PMW1_9HELO
MGSNDIPPPHVARHVVPVCNGLLQIGGTLWTICYVLMVRESLRTKSYGMPLFALAFNLAWEVVYAVVVAEERLEQFCFGVWLVIDCGLVYGVVRHGRNEWAHAPLVQRHVGLLFGLLAAACVLAHWTFARWWLAHGFGGGRPGKSYGGVDAAVDTTELGYWTAMLAQVILSAMSLAQLLVREHSGGVSWSIWAARALGSVVGLDAQYAWAWYYWRDAHEYFMSPFSVFLWSTGLLCDAVYPFVLWRVRKTERVAEDGRKIRGSLLLESDKHGKQL